VNEEEMDTGLTALMVLLPFLFLLWGVILRRRVRAGMGPTGSPVVSEADVTDESAALLRIVCGGVVGDLHLTYPFLKLLLFADHVTLKCFGQCTVLKYHDISGLSEIAGFTARGLRIDHTKPTAARPIVVWSTDDRISRIVAERRSVQST
jgi:hypothetical protein